MQLINSHYSNDNKSLTKTMMYNLFNVQYLVSLVVVTFIGQKKALLPKVVHIRN